MKIDFEEPKKMSSEEWDETGPEFKNLTFIDSVLELYDNDRTAILSAEEIALKTRLNCGECVKRKLSAFMSRMKRYKRQPLIESKKAKGTTFYRLV